MPKGVRMASENVELMVKYREEGKTIKELSEMFGCSEKTVIRYTNGVHGCARSKGGVVSRTIQLPPDRDAIRAKEEAENAWKYSCAVVEHVVNLIGVSTNTTYTLNIGTNIAEIQFDKCEPVKVPFAKLEGLVEEFKYMADQAKPFIKKV